MTFSFCSGLSQDDTAERFMHKRAIADRYRFPERTYRDLRRAVCGTDFALSPRILGARFATRQRNVAQQRKGLDKSVIFDLASNLANRIH